MRLLDYKMLISIGTFLLFLFLFYPSSSVIAQTGKTKFTGVVTDSKGSPLEGVTVTVRGTQQKTSEILKSFQQLLKWLENQSSVIKTKTI